MKIMHFFWLSVFSLLLNAILAQDLLLENAQLVNPENQSIETASLWLKEGKIHQKLNEAPVVFAGERLDLTGKFVLPGLIDLHTHSWGNMGVGGNLEMLMTGKTANRMLYCGVTSFLDLFSEENSILNLRDRQRSEGFPGADIYCAGPILTCEGGHGTEYGIPTRTINNPEEARQQVADLAKRKPDVVKIVYDNAPGRMPTIDRATFEAAVAEAKNHKLKTVIHIGTWQDIITSLEVGASAVTHLPAEEMPAEVPSLFLKTGAVIIPTLTVESDLMHLLEQPQILDSKLLAGASSPQVINSYRNPEALDPRSQGFLEFQKAHKGHLAPAIQALHQAGVPVLVGTDAGNPGVFQGYSVHREMKLLAQSGMPPWEVLAATTTAAGDFLGLPNGFEPGDVASLLVLNQNPVEDLGHAEDIHLLIHHGKIVDREALAFREVQSGKRTEKLIADFEATGLNWSAMSDEIQGGISTASVNVQNGSLKAKGELKIGDRMPYAWTMFNHNFHSNGQAEDLTDFEGLELRYRLKEGTVYVSLNDGRIQNFDYHAAFLATGEDWQEVKIPFSSLRQNFTQPPVKWNGERILGLAFGSSGQEGGAFELEVDWIRLY
jgi:imidazolonepropionase-like amidohydrolase